MTKKRLLFLLLALSSCNYQPKRVEFEPYVSPEEINLRLEKIEVGLKNTPRDNTLRLDYAEACIRKLEYNYLMDLNTPYPGPSSSRVYQDFLLTKSIDSVLGAVLSEDSLSERALSLRFRNRLRYPIFSSWPPYNFSGSWPLRIGAWPSYFEDTIPKTISALLRTRTSSIRGLDRYASAFDFQACDFSREDAVRLCYDDFEEAGDMLHELGRVRWARTEGERRDPRVLFDLWALKYGVERRTSYSLPVDFLFNGFDTNAFFWGYHEVVKKFPSIAQFIFFKDMSARIVTGLKEDENEKYVMNPLRQLIRENPKLCSVYYYLILFSLKNKDFASAIQWITQATKEVPNFTLTQYPRNDLVSNAMDTLRSLAPSIPSLQLDCLNRKYSFERIWANEDSLVEYFADLEKLESTWVNYWGHLELKVAILESVIWSHDSKGIDRLDSRIWPTHKKKILSEWESCVFQLLNRYAEMGYFPKLNTSMPMWFATHGFMARGKQLLQNLVSTAPQLTEEFLFPEYVMSWGKSAKTALSLIENLRLIDSSCLPLLWWITGNAYLTMDVGEEERHVIAGLRSYYDLLWISGTASAEGNNTRQAILFLEKASRAGQEQATQVLFDIHVNAKRYEKAIPLCDALANNTRRHMKLYRGYPYVGWWIHMAQKAYLLRKIGREAESDSILTQLYASYPEEYAVYYGHALCLSEEQRFSDGLHIIELGLKKGKNPDWGRYDMIALRDSISAKMRK